MSEVPTCPRCGKVCNGGWVSSPVIGILCRECFYRDEFPKIKIEENRRARPWKILFYGGVVILVGLMIRLILTIWNMIV